ncbi:hypothetical protein ACLKA7_001972 [Drosophila subpalustris]
MRIEAFILPHIITDQPAQNINNGNWKMPKNRPLADPQFNKPEKIDMLIGAEHYYALLLPQQHKLMPSGPMMQQTKLGWVVAGKMMEPNMSPAICAVATGEETNAILERFWSLDNFDKSEKHRTPVEKACEKHFIDNLQIAADGRFIALVGDCRKKVLVVGKKD